MSKDLGRIGRWAAGVLVVLIMLTGCIGPDDSAQEIAVSDERCEQNRVAGTISYVTGYQYQASASILEVISAEAMGYYDAMCLDVQIEAGTGDTGLTAQLLAAGRAQFASMGQQDVLLSNDNGVAVTGVSSYSTAGLEVLLTMPDITELPQLDGTVLGHKGAMPTTVVAMLEESGVDVASLTQVTVGFDPSVLPRGQVESLTGFLSNEPNQLAAEGVEVTVWRPYHYGIPSSLGAIAANPAFVDDHPSASEDFLRATFRAFDHCVNAAEECVGYAAELSGAGYDVEHNLGVWRTESQVVADTANGQPLGTIDADNVWEINAMLSQYGLLRTPLDDQQVAELFDSALVPALYQGQELVWPVP